MSAPVSVPTPKSSLVQIEVSTAEILRRIASFQSSKREEVNRENIIEFCHTAYQDGGQTCARVDAVVTKRSDCKSHVKVYRVVNEWGPQLGVPDPSIKAEYEKYHNGEAVPIPPAPIDERLFNAEVHLKLEANCPVPTDIYSRLRCIEQRILSLEGISPEYADKVADRVRLVLGKDVPHIPVNKRRNPKMELTKPDLTKLLAYMEGELQAKDVVIATLKSERVRQLVSGAAGRAGERLDRFATGQERSPLTTMAGSACDEAEQMTSLDNLVLSQRRAQLRMCRILKEAEERHRKVIQELEEEKRKHEHDTAQGDDITYGLERERTRLKLELELEKQGKKKLEKELKKVTEILDEERSRQKQMVIMLLLDRKKFANKYLEERKRSEDLAQILAEEKSRIDMMAEGLEEESKKSLQMEAELEKQLAQFDMERQQNRVLLAKEEKRCKELAAELERSRGEAESGSLAKKGSRPPPQPPAKPTPGGPRPIQNAPGTGATAGAGGAAMTSSVAKVVQPTATVSSVPVSAPTTGIARSVLPGQAVRPHETASAPGKPSEGRGRGAPPPVPPNKPVVPPKKEVTLRPPSAPAAPAAALAAAAQGLSQDPDLTQLAPT